LPPVQEDDLEQHRPATEMASTARRDLLATLAFFALALTGYLTFFTAHYSYDSVASGVLLYQWIASGRFAPLLHRYHVLYLPAAASAELFLRTIGVQVDPLTLLQALNAFCAAASVALYYRLMRAFELDSLLSAILTLLFGGGFSVWYYATNGEPYPISWVFLILAFLTAARMREGASALRSSVPGAWLGLGAAFHGTCLLALPGLAVLSWPHARTRGGARRIAGVIVAAGLVVGAPYAVRSLLTQRSDPASGIAADTAAFAREEGWSRVPQLIDQWRGLAWSMAPTDWPSLPTSHPLVTRTASQGLLAATLLPFLLLLGCERGRRKAAIGAAVWFAVSFLFFSVYFAGSPKFAGYQWAPLLLLIGLALQHSGAHARVRLSATAAFAALACTTLVCSFDLARRQTDPASNPHLARALAIARLTKPNDLVVHLGRGENQYQKVYTPYFAARRSLVVERYFDPEHASVDQSMQALEARLATATAGPGRIVALSDAIEPGASSREFEKANGLQEGSLARFFAAYHPDLLAQDPAAGKLWLLTAPAEKGPQEIPRAAALTR